MQARWWQKDLEVRSFLKMKITFVVLFYQVKYVALIPFLWLVNSVEHLFFFSKYDLILIAIEYLTTGFLYSDLLHTESGE